MKSSRRKFLAGLVTSIALSPLLCRAMGGLKFATNSQHRPPLELWEMESTWDGVTTSPYFKSRYDQSAPVIEPGEIVYENIKTGEPEWVPESDAALVKKAHQLSDEDYNRMRSEEEQEWYQKFIRDGFAHGRGKEPKPGSFADSVFPL